MASALDDLLDLLDLEQIEVNVFRGLSPDEDRQRTFGGQVAGQALVAAVRTVDHDRAVHSLHAYFLRPGDPAAPILYTTDRIRDGRSFTTRRVVAVQHGRAIFNLQASFQRAEDGWEYQSTMPAVPGPDELPTWQERIEPVKHLLEGDWFDRPRPIDLRYADGRPPGSGSATSVQRVWMKADGDLPDNPALHACIVTYASDMTLLDTVVMPHGTDWTQGTVQMASLDHAMWFHQPFRADEWLLFDQRTHASFGARGLANGEIYTRDGRLAVSVVQEGLIRPIQPVPR